MRRALIPWVLFGLALVAIAVPMAEGTSSAKDPRVAGLVKKVSALTKRVAVLEVRSACISVTGVTSYGAPSSNDGYLYHRAADPADTIALTTALDYTEQGGTPQALMAVVDPKCVTGSRTLYRITPVRAHKSALYRAAAR
jgi:hypothetical protein